MSNCLAQFQLTLPPGLSMGILVFLIIIGLKLPGLLPLNRSGIENLPLNRSDIETKILCMMNDDKQLVLGMLSFLTCLLLFVR